MNRAIDTDRLAERLAAVRQGLVQFVNPATGDDEEDAEFIAGALHDLDLVISELGYCNCAARGWGGAAGHADDCLRLGGRAIVRDGLEA